MLLYLNGQILENAMFKLSKWLQGQEKTFEFANPEFGGHPYNFPIDKSLI